MDSPIPRRTPRWLSLLCGLALLLSCQSASDEPNDDDTGDDDTGDDDTGDDDTGDDDTTFAQCPVGMSAIRSDPSGAIEYCIDTYEVTVTGDLGSFDQYEEGATPATARAESLAGVIPSSLVSFGQALKICTNTPVTDDDGSVIGYKRMATTAQWRDAADGQVGEGGLAFPYGDEYDPAACACTESDGSVVTDEAQPAGSLEGCVSPFGVYDQCGNYFEWTDPEELIDVEGWLVAAEELGHQLFYGETNQLGSDYVAASEAFWVEFGWVSIEGVGTTSNGVLRIDDDGWFWLWIDPADWTPDGRPDWGFLVLNEPVVDGQSHYLPITIDPVDEDAAAAYQPLLIHHDEDGHPLTQKIGGSYYMVDACWGMWDTTRSHLHSFKGSITFRCAFAPP